MTLQRRIQDHRTCSQRELGQALATPVEERMPHDGRTR